MLVWWTKQLQDLRFIVLIQFEIIPQFILMIKSCYGKLSQSFMYKYILYMYIQDWYIVPVSLNYFLDFIHIVEAEVIW